jgi:hypothetical protein
MRHLVAKFYRALLNREPEPGGQAAWASILRQARLAIALAGFVPSPEFRGLLPDRTNHTAVSSVVSRLYTEILQRAPEPEDLAAWVDFIVATGDLKTVARGFLTSGEFESRALTLPEFVTILYRTLLGREPDAVGLSGWHLHARATVTTESVARSAGPSRTAVGDAVGLRGPSGGAHRDRHAALTRT